MSQFQGQVDILGAGPGAPDFLTLAGRDLLAKAEVLIYDALVDPTLLTLTKENCNFIAVGKRGGQPSPLQAEINQILISACQQGRRVVRLKCGDPFVFGRTASEVEALAAAHCEVYVWPGLSSALAAPLLAGIPLTDKDCSQVITLLSGHNPTSLNWSAIAQSDTVVILMGTRTLESLLQALLSAGKPAKTPIAIIQWCSWPEQRCWVGTLGTILQDVEPHQLSPAVVVVGVVVALKDKLNLPSITSSKMKRADQPLWGKKIVITRATDQSSAFRDRLESLGASVLDLPALEIVPPSSWQGIDQAIQELEKFQWLILTSANAVEYFFLRLLDCGRDARALASLKVAVVGRKTARKLNEKGLKPDFIPPNYVADSLVETFPQKNLSDVSLLFPRVESGGRDVLVKSFRDRGAVVKEVSAYQSRCPKNIPQPVVEAFRSGQVDAVTFASSKTVKHVLSLLQEANQSNPVQNSVMDWLSSVCIASIGPQTSRTCLDQIGRVDTEAQEYTLEGLIRALIEFYRHED